MPADPIALATFVLITNFTPGPNNASSASMGILHGYRNTLGYLAGITAGFFLVMLLCGWVSTSLLQVFPAIENTLRILGAAYILWLAFHTLKASYALQENGQAVLGFSRGFVLQLLNPKVIIYGLTVYSTFLGAAVTSPPALLASALALAGVGFVAISAWTLFGATIRAYVNRPRVRQVLNAALALLLVYTAVELSGLL